MNLAHYRTLVRRDLGDTVAGEERWTDAELDRHIVHAVRDLSYAAPQQAVVTLTATGGRQIDVSGLPGLLEVQTIAPAAPNADSGSPLPFRQWAGAVTIEAAAPPSAGQTLQVTYSRLHTVDAKGATVPAELEDTVALGAAAYAALALANRVINRVNVGGPQTAERYRAWGNDRLAAFQGALRLAARRQGVRTRRLYATGHP